MLNCGGYDLLPLPLEPREVYGNCPDRLVSVVGTADLSTRYRRSESHPGTCQGELSIRSDLVAQAWRAIQRAFNDVSKASMPQREGFCRIYCPGSTPLGGDA